MNNFHYVKLSGSPKEIGLSHGRLLKDRIVSTWDFYSRVLFGNQLSLLEDYGGRYLEVIQGFADEYREEIEAVAEGSGLPAWQIAILNARTEIFHILRGRPPANECTAAFLPGSRVLGQNWDWMAELEPLVVLMEIEREDGHRILQLTEPGIIGKIGFNSKGIGVCLNILTGGQSPVAVPIHILLRAALDGDDLEEIYARFSALNHGTYSNILMADDQGRCVAMEFAGTSMKPLDYKDGRPLHTNHYLSELSETQATENDPLYENSMARYRRGCTLLKNLDRQAGVDELKSILRDREDVKHKISAEYKTRLGLQIGTVSSIIMDLPNREMHAALGVPHKNHYQVFQLA